MHKIDLFKVKNRRFLGRLCYDTLVQKSALEFRGKAVRSCLLINRVFLIANQATKCSSKFPVIIYATA